jgi:MEMO1 family protein
MYSVLRLPAVDGRFYASDPEALARDVERLMQSPATASESRGRPVSHARAVVVPHAGYVYSGSIAGATFARVAVPDCVVILGPNHTGLGARRALWSRGAWRVPLADVPIAEDLADALGREAALEHDAAAHLREHSIEVELPFLVRCRPDVHIVPVCLALLDADECRAIGVGIARAVRSSGREVLLVASTDMSHYVSAETARARDQLALARLLALDPEGLYQTVVEHDISMCGFVPTCVALFAARELGAISTELVRYGNSGETSGDFQRVVGYAGVVIA